MGITLSHEDIIIEAARSVVVNTLGHDFYSDINGIASMYYERSEVKGRLLFYGKSSPDVSLLRFSEPVSLSDCRSVRKFLEMCDEDSGIVCQDGLAIGLTRRPKKVGRDPAPYEVHFPRQHHWTLSSPGVRIVDVEYGSPHAPRESLTQPEVAQALRSTFAEVSEEQIRRIWELAEAASEGGHGTILVVSSMASTEAHRLASQATCVSPVPMTPDLLSRVTRIDGAVLCSLEGECHAIGVILDGLATTHGDRSRGSRFNSAIRFVESRPDCLALVVSDDGMIDLVTRKDREASADFLAEGNSAGGRLTEPESEGIREEET